MHFAQVLLHLSVFQDLPNAFLTNIEGLKAITSLTQVILFLAGITLFAVAPGLNEMEDTYDEAYL